SPRNKFGQDSVDGAALEVQFLAPSPKPFLPRAQTPEILRCPSTHPNIITYMCVSVCVCVLQCDSSPVRGTWSENSWMWTRPAASPSTSKSKNTVVAAAE